MDQDLGEIGIDPPIAFLVGHGQGLARDSRPDPHVVELLGASTQTGFDVAQALAIGKLGEGQAQEVVPAGEAAHSGIAPVALHAALKLPVRRMGHHLREERLPWFIVHSHPRNHGRVTPEGAEFKSFHLRDPCKLHQVMRLQHHCRS